MSKEYFVIHLGVDNLNVNQHIFCDQLNRDIHENALGFSKEAIIGLKSHGGSLKGKGTEFLPNKGWHNTGGWPLINDASMNN